MAQQEDVSHYCGSKKITYPGECTFSPAYARQMANAPTPSSAQGEWFSVVPKWWPHRILNLRT